MKIRIVGSLAGMTPHPDRIQTGWILERNSEETYWFDLGEGTSRAAFLAGYPPGKACALFLSHPHIDHVGDALHFFANIREKRPRELLFYVPEMELSRHIIALLQELDSMPRNVKIVPKPLADGPVFRAPEIAIHARHNLHLAPAADGTFRSYSFRIEAEGHSIVYSGDVKDAGELGDWLDDCDLLLMETGHHSAPELCARFKKEKRGIRRLVFLHHGFEVMDHFDRTLERACAAWGSEVEFAGDGMEINFDAKENGR